MMETIEHSLGEDETTHAATARRRAAHWCGQWSGLAPHRRASAARGPTARAELQLELEQDASTRGHEDRIERVIGHAVQNAFDASTPSQPVRLSIAVKASSVQIRVIDEGCGMSADFVRERSSSPSKPPRAMAWASGLSKVCNMSTSLAAR